MLFRSLATKLLNGGVTEHDCDMVRKRREFPVKMTQQLQVAMQNNVISAALHDTKPFKVPLPVRIVDALPFLQGLLARVIGLGFRPEHVQSPERK